MRKLPRERDMNLPKINNIETTKIVMMVFREFGSIRLCNDKYDFGRYRLRLVELFDKEITELKKENKT